MILYTTGTGNTQWAANTLGAMLNENVVCITDELDKNPNPQLGFDNDKRIIIMQPVHSWGPALVVERFIDKTTFNADCEVWDVCVCGDMCCNTDKILAELLRSKGIKLKGCFSVQMPNNYILMKGFGIDTDEVAKHKIDVAQIRLAQIASSIIADLSNEELYTRGSLPALKSFVYKIFKKYAVKKVKFYSNDKCTHCGHCAKICPTHNITMIDGKPQWGKDCVQCLACIHRCPSAAIEYGKVTIDAGRYHHPSVK